MPSIFNTVSMINGKLVQFDDMLIKYGSTDDKPTPTPTPVDPLNPLGLPPFTIRCKFTQGVTPTPGVYDEGGTSVTWDKLVCVDETENIWDITKNSPDWSVLLSSDDHSSTNIHVEQVLGANTTGVTNMSRLLMWNKDLVSVAIFDTASVVDFSSMFYGCHNLENIPVYNMDSAKTLYSFLSSTAIQECPALQTGSVTDMGYLFAYCYSLRHVPLLDTTHVENVSSICEECWSVTSGAYELYEQLVQQHGNDIEHGDAFLGCGNVSQIPESWGGTKPDEDDEEEDEP